MTNETESSPRARFLRASLASYQYRYGTASVRPGAALYLLCTGRVARWLHGGRPALLALVSSDDVM